MYATQLHIRALVSRCQPQFHFVRSVQPVQLVPSARLALHYISQWHTSEFRKRTSNTLPHTYLHICTFAHLHTLCTHLCMSVYIYNKCVYNKVVIYYVHKRVWGFAFELHLNEAFCCCWCFGEYLFAKPKILLFALLNCWPTGRLIACEKLLRSHVCMPPLSLIFAELCVRGCRELVHHF